MQFVSLAGYCACLLAVSASTEPRECRVAIVTSVRASVRSGPSRDHYVTDRIDRETVVEVYAATEEGWLAIRPPVSSYSWIAATAARPTSDPQMAEVVGTDVVAWIGSNTTPPQNHQWQVRLNAGELVEILGQTDIRLVENASSKRCYKIAPPAGEFRWVHQGDVRFSERSETGETTDDGFRVADYQVPVGAKPGQVDPAARFVTPRKPGESGYPRMASRNPTPRKMPPRYSKPLGEADLDELNLELSLMVSQDPDLWDLTPLKVAAERQSELAKTPLDRARAKRLLERVREFQSLQDRRRQLAVMAIATGEPAWAGHERASDLDESPPRTSDRAPDDASRQVASTDGKDRPQKDPLPGTDPRFDASGWLVPVHSTKRDAPPYALIDDEGNVIQYVSPSPGLNLHRYLRKKVGIYGDQNFQASLKATHVVAERVVDLERKQR